MNRQDLLTLVDYHYWARDRLLDAAEHLEPGQLTQRIESSFPSIRETLAHLCGAEWVWIARWDGDSPVALPNGSDLTDLAAIRAEWLAQEHRLRAVLVRLGDHGIDQPLEYRGFDGRQYRQLFSEMLQHVVEPGTGIREPGSGDLFTSGQWTSGFQWEDERVCEAPLLS